MTGEGWLWTTCSGVLNLTALLVGGPLIAGLSASVRARLTGGSGPPILQPFFDLVKLFGKEELFTAGDVLGRGAPVVGLASLGAAALLVPVGAGPLALVGDGLALLGLVAVVGAAAAVATATDRVGKDSACTVLSAVAVEPTVVLSLLTAMVGAGSFSAVPDFTAFRAGMVGIAATLGAGAMLIALIAAAAEGTPRLPAAHWADGADLPGLSGPKLAMAWWTAHARLVLYGAIFVGLYLPGSHVPRGGWDHGAYLAKALALVVLVHLAAGPAGRLFRVIRAEIWVGAAWLLGLAGFVAGLFWG